MTDVAYNAALAALKDANHVIIECGDRVVIIMDKK